MKRTEIINHLIKQNNYESYLEIGVQSKAYNFYQINVKRKIGVDPDPNARAEYMMTSDEFFRQNNIFFDIIFVDGLHLKKQFIKDVQNSLKSLNEGGTIVCHDCLPSCYEEQTRSPTISVWTGDVWKGMAYFRMTNPNISIDVVDTDLGCGVVRKGAQELYVKNEGKELDYKYYENNRNKLMNVISIEEFLNKY